ncbi:MAG: glycosyltransferase family 2 protein [Verrucomicrobiota bacterium]|nr:glycosyltransferase family 2 protein [Limisphaera sp.]MDW8381082.1 glycosyltransferase family 2 protein [Verrucomicrobiota bacterium]
MNPTLTIGIPFYNPGPAFLDCLKSIWAQSFQDWELLLVDDGSSDSSLTLALRIRDSRVRIIYDGRHLGLSARLNQISHLARGTYVARMDADDMMHPNRLERQLAAFHAQPNLDFVSTNAYILSPEGYVLGIRRAYPLTPTRILLNGCHLHASLVARRSWFLAHPYSVDYVRGQDRELFARTAQTASAKILNEPLYFYRYIVNFRAWQQGYRTERMVLRTWGPSLIGSTRTAVLYLFSLFKATLLRIFARAGCSQYLARKAILPLSELQRQHVEDILKHIRTTRVPGLSDES